MVRKHETKKETHRFSVSSLRRNNIKKIIQNIAGFSDYEKNIISLIRLGKDKKALKFGKKRLGNMKRAKKKKELLNLFIRSKNGI